MNFPEVSVSIVNWNSSSQLKRCLDSVYSQEGVDKEVIVVDNASSDFDPRLFEKSYPSLKLLVNKENVGFAKALNQAVGVSNGEYLLFLNPDVEFEGRDGLRQLLDFIRKDRKIAIVGPKLLNPDGSLQPSGRKFPSFVDLVYGLDPPLFSKFIRHDPFQRTDFDKVVEVDEVSGACFLIRKDVFKAVGGFDENFFLYFEEVDLCKRVKRMGFKVYYYPEVKVFHQWGASSRKNPLSRKHMLSSRFYYCRKHYGFLCLLVLRLIYAVLNVIKGLR